MSMSWITSTAHLKRGCEISGVIGICVIRSYRYLGFLHDHVSYNLIKITAQIFSEKCFNNVILSFMLYIFTACLSYSASASVHIIRINYYRNFTIAQLII